MGYKAAFEDVLRSYERERDRARAVLESKRREVYAAIPRVETIDEKLKLVSLRIARRIIIGAENPQKALRRLREENAELLREKRKLLAESRFGADYLAETYCCPICRDTGFVGSEKCACLKQRLIEKHYDYSNLRETLSRENYDFFQEYYYSDDSAEDGLSPRETIRIIHQRCMEFVSRFHLKKGRGAGNIMFYGETGLGKTFLCNCVAREILDRGWTVLYLTAPRIFKLLEDYRFNRSEMEAASETVDALTDVDLLIIDDLGTEVPTLVTSAEIFNLLNMRILDSRSTVLSTNLTPGQLENTYSERLLSRLFGYYNLLKIIGEDIRVKKKFMEPLQENLA
jgi:DNA replication protein DnaC